VDYRNPEPGVYSDIMETFLEWNRQDLY
jgi:hypothetical protein